MSKNIMKIEFNVEDMLMALKDSIRDELSAEMLTGIKFEVMRDFKKQIEEEMKQAISINANETVKEMILDIIDNTKLQIGGSWDKEPTEFTLREYAKKEIKEIIANNKVDGKGYDGISFHKWFTDKCVNTEVENFINKEILLIKKDINNKISNTFNKQTKELLSETVLNMLMATDTYKKIENGMKQIAQG